jgi:single-strand DNA-binding protein
MNKAILIGHLGKEPELRSTTGGKSVATFSIATTERWKDAGGEKKEQTTWHNIVAWGSLAEVCAEYLHKGSKVLIEGKITNRSYDDKSGVKRYITEIVAKELEMLDEKPNHATLERTETATATVSHKVEPEETDDLPF